MQRRITRQRRQPPDVALTVTVSFVSVSGPALDEAALAEWLRAAILQHHRTRAGWADSLPGSHDARCGIAVPEVSIVSSKKDRVS